jgi:ABC-type transport system involved in Fe-S cluster assembly fused permease/ATPase subunit
MFLFCKMSRAFLLWNVKKNRECEKKKSILEGKSYSVFLNFDKICQYHCKVYDIFSFKLNYSKYETCVNNI